MGRTIPSFRLAIVEEEREWKVFRNDLDGKKGNGKYISICHVFSVKRAKESSISQSLINTSFRNG
jgi:hypothetical protein